MLMLSCGGSPPPSAPTLAPTPAPSHVATVMPPVAAPAVPSDDAAIAEACQAYVDLQATMFPERATILGMHTRDTELEDRSHDGYELATASEEKMLVGLKARFSSPHASRAAQTDLDILTHTLAVDVRTRRDLRPHETQPDIYNAPMTAIFMMTSRDYAPAGERAKNVLARLEKIPTVIAAAKANLKNPPRLWTQIAIESAAGAKGFFDEQRAPLETALPADKARVAAALKTATDAYADYKAFLTKEVLPRSSGDFAAGKAYFEFLVHEDYFLAEDSDALLAIGKKIFADTNAQMTDVAKRIDPTAKSWGEVIGKLKKNHPTADDVLAAYRKEVTRAKAFLIAKDAIAFPAGDDLRVMDTPTFQRSTIGSAAYDAPPPFDKNTQGFFFVTPVDRNLSKAKQEEMLREDDHGDLVNTAVHEAYPGHHLQLSFARMHPSVIRKATGPAIFSEGWALYSEEVLSELGYYTDEERLMQLQWTLVRAARVILDVSLHTRGMTYDQAVKMLTDEVHLERTLALNEARRYTASPTQPLAYIVGREMIFRFREHYKTQEKEKYSLKRFHTELLSHGTIAPGLVEREMFP